MSHRHPLWLLPGLAVFLSTVSPISPASSINGKSWLPIGPAPIATADPQFFTGGWVGRATAVAVNPDNPDDVWLGTAGGGVWHSTDAGANWRAMTDTQASLAIGSLALAECDASACLTVYAGTGENAIRRDTYYGQGLLVGRSGGPTGVYGWTLRKGTPTYDFSRGSITNVLYDPNTSGNSRVVYIALSGGVTASATESTVTAPEPSPGGYGIYKSGDDTATWTLLTVPGAEGERPTDLEMHPTSPNVLYAGFLGTGIFRSEDGGASWCPLQHGTGVQICNGVSGLPSAGGSSFDHVEIAFSRSNPAVIYATLGHCPDQLLGGCYPSVFRSGDGGQTWEERLPGTSNPPDLGCPTVYSRYTHALTVDPGDADALFLGGIFLCKSENGGVSFLPTDTNTIKGITHLDHRSVVFHDTMTSRVYEVSDGGVTVSQDGGDTWTPRNDDLQITGFQGIDFVPQKALLLGGTQDNGGVMWKGGRVWDQLNCCGDGGFSIVDRDSAMRMFITTNAAGTVHPLRSQDGGVIWGGIAADIPDGEPRSFYPAFVQDLTPPRPLYFGTNRLHKSGDDGTNWDPVSPVLSNTSQPEIVGGQDVISAIGVAPSNPARVYLGYYGGKIFVTDAACTNQNCWPERSAGLPGTPITWIAVDPQNADRAYATTSGFHSGVHVFKTENAGVLWQATGSTTGMNGVPANVIAIEPSAAGYLWLGTDNGIFKSTNSGGAWTRFSDGLPNVPVYQIAIDEPNGRVYAATHGRGAYVLTKPYVNNFEGWVGDSIWDIPVYGNGFLPNQNCTMYVLRQDASICASGPVDANGGTVKTDANGTLVTDKNTYWSGQPVAWACLNSDCVGGVDISVCNPPSNPLSTVLVACGAQLGIDHVTGCPPLSNPPPSIFTLDGLPDIGAATRLGYVSEDNPTLGYVSETNPTFGSWEEDRFARREVTQDGVAPSGTFELAATVHSGDGTSHKLCTVKVPVAPGDTADTVLTTAANQLATEPACVAASVNALLIPPAIEPEIEDLFPSPPGLAVLAPASVGGQVIASIHAPAGETTGLCFRLGHLGLPVGEQIRIMRVRFETAAAGAAGGEVRIVERSTLGTCDIRVPTAVGDSPAGVAQAVAAAFQTPGIPGPHPGCEANQNPRDIAQHGDSIVTTLPSGVEVCTYDPGVGFTLAPEEICFKSSDCDDGNPCTGDFCHEASGLCEYIVLEDGLACEDANPCTSGDLCRGGVCGSPVTCEDGDLCTFDFCDREIGRCLNQPVTCNDGNSCTSEVCDRQTGRCVIRPDTGVTCDDGDRCTAPDVCVQDATGAVTCQGGASTCDDRNACTADVCDPLTGQCANVPVACDDGNPCTFDFCDADSGACRFAPLIGQQCDDGNRCTRDDVCRQISTTGGVACVGQPLVCADQNLCTTDFCDDVTGECRFMPLHCNDSDVCTGDTCDPTVGLCVNPPIPVGAVETIQFRNPTTLFWPETADATHWNTYRGTIPARGMASRPAGSEYDHSCYESDDAFGDGANISTDASVPPSGTAYYYVVTGESGCGESVAALNSANQPIPMPSFCPTPP